jgi:hypothetical protein
MTLFGKRKPPPVSQPPFPVIDPSQGPQIVSLINQYQSAPTIADTQGPANGLMTLSGASPIDQNRSLWVWFASWCTMAREMGQPFVAVRIAEFVQYYDDVFYPNAGPARMFLFKATDAQREIIERAAYDACGDLDPAMPIRPEIDFPIAVFQWHLGERINHPEGSAHREVNYGSEDVDLDHSTLAAQIAESEAHRRRTAPSGVTMSGGPDDDLHRFVIDIREPGDAEIQVIVQTFVEAVNEQDAADRVAQMIGTRQVRAVQILAPSLVERTGSDAWWWDGTTVRPWFGLSDEIPSQGSFRVAWSVFVDAASVGEAVGLAFDRHAPGAPDEHAGFLVTDHQGQIWTIWAGMPWD